MRKTKIHVLRFISNLPKSYKYNELVKNLFKECHSRIASAGQSLREGQQHSTFIDWMQKVKRS